MDEIYFDPFGCAWPKKLFWWNVVMKNVFSLIKKQWVVRFLNSICVAKHSFGRSFCFVLFFKKMKENFEKPFWTNVFLKTTWEKTSHKKIPSNCKKKQNTVFLETIGFSWQYWRTETTTIKKLSTNYRQAISDDFFSNAGSLQQSYLFLLFSWKHYLITQKNFSS